MTYHNQYLRVGDGSQPFFFQLVNCFLVLPQVKLGSYQDNWHLWAMVTYLWVPISSHIFKTGRAYQGEANQKNIHLRIGERPQPVVIFLSSCVPQAQVDWAAIDLKPEKRFVDGLERFSEAHHNIGRIVVKHCRYVFTRKCIGSVAN